MQDNLKKEVKKEVKRNGFIYRMEVLNDGETKIYKIYFGPNEKEMILYGSYQVENEAEWIFGALSECDKRRINKIYYLKKVIEGIL